MTNRDINKFGTSRRVFKGNGVAIFSDGIEVKTRITLTQLVDTQLIFIADVRRPIWDFLANIPPVIEFKGKLIDGRSVSVQGLVIKECRQVSQYRTRLIGYSGQWIIGEPDFKEATLICFELVNFLFLGTEKEVFIEGDNQRSSLSLMALKLGNKEIKLRRVVDYDQTEASLRAQHGLQVTCTAITTIEDSTELDTVVSTIDTLCDVMTVARGTLVNWISFDAINLESGLPYSRYRNSVTRDFSEIDLIHYTDPQNTKSFLEKGFSRCQEIEPDFQITRIARAFTETRGGSFIESRSLLIGVLVEYITSVKARLDDCTYILNQETFESQWDSLKVNVKTILKLTYPQIAGKYLSVMLSNIRGLNRLPFSWKLNYLAKWLDIKFEPGEIEKFIVTRNKLAHEGRFPETGSPSEHYLRMQWFIDRLMLRLFDYHGPYYDFEHREIRQI